jgi:bacteriophage HK97-gp10 putative tail-component
MSEGIKGLENFNALSAKVDRFKQEFANGLKERIEEYSPVDTGEMKESWEVQIDDSKGAIYVTNSATDNQGVPYAPFVETGTPTMEGHFMVSRAVAEAEQIAATAKRKAGL